MVSVFILFVFSLIALAMAFFSIGKSSAYKHFIKSKGKESEKDLKSEVSSNIPWIVYWLIVAIGFDIIIVFAADGILREKYINDWRSHRVIEKIERTYNIVDNDTTYLSFRKEYIKNPNFEK